MTNEVKTKTTTTREHLLPSGNERLLILEQIRRLWKHRKPDPIQKLRTMRREWDRKLPPPK